MAIDSALGRLGIKQGVCTSSTRPTNPFEGQVIYESDTNRTLVYDNAAWVVVADSQLLSIDTTNSNVNIPSLKVNSENVTPYTGRRNVLINGDMRIAQRGTSVSHTSGGGGSYFHCDRWRGSDYNWSGNTITRSQSTDAPDGFTNSLKWENDSNTLTFGSGGSMYIEQRIEGYNVSHLYDSTYATLSFWVKSSTAGTYTCHFSNGGFARILQKEFSITSANTWEHKSIVIPMSSGTSSGTWPTDNTMGMRVQWYIGAHADRTGNDYLDSWGNISNYHYLTTNSVNLATTPNSSFYLTGVQLEAGDKATPFEHRSFGEELALCQRYYEKTYNATTPPATNTLQGAVYFVANSNQYSDICYNVEFAVEKRAIPSMTFVRTSGSDNNWDYTRSSDGTSGAGAPQWNGSWNGSHGGLFYLNIGAAWTNGLFYGHWVAVAEL